MTKNIMNYLSQYEVQGHVETSGEEADTPHIIEMIKNIAKLISNGSVKTPQDFEKAYQVPSSQTKTANPTSTSIPTSTANTTSTVNTTNVDNPASVEEENILENTL